MKRIGLVLVLGVVVSVLTCSNIWAQATAQISGTVHDQSGAVLPGVEVTATQTETGIIRMTVTNETGTFVLPNLPLGPYKVEAALSGFRTFVQTGVVLQVGSSPAINAVMEVGQVTEQVEVQANAAQVETRSTAVGEVIESQRIVELPLPGRNVTDLITLTAGSSQGGAGSVPGGFVRGTSAAANYVSVGGGVVFGVMYALDGAMHNNGYDNSQIPFPFPDALQEFKVDSAGASAAGGSRGSSGQVSAVTKSGTNELHGSAFEFVRNYLFNGRNPFSTTRDDLKRNQFGGTLGGPVLKNKLFLFGGIQRTLTRTAGAGNIGFVPTPAMMAGDFTAFASPACNGGRQINLAAPFVGNKINPASFNASAVAVAKLLPAATNDCGLVNYNIPSDPNEYQFVDRVDYQQSAKHSIFQRYIVTHYVSPHPYNLTHDLLALNTTDGGNSDIAHGFAIGSTYLFSPNTINSFRVGMTRVVVGRPGDVNFFGPADIGVNAYSLAPHQMTITITGGLNMNTRHMSARNPSDAFNVNDDVNLVRGNHQITFGGNVSNYRTYQRCGVNGDGSYSFTGQATGLGYADFLTGNLTGLTQKTPVVWSSHQYYVASYVQDVWKASPRMTLNAGVRWEPFLPLAIGRGKGANLTEGAMYNFSQDRFNQGVRSTQYPNAPVGLYYPGDPGFPGTGVTNAKFHYFAPRVGLAWDVRGDGKTSVRASFGVAFDFSGAQTYGGSSSAPPWGFVTTVSGVNFTNPWANQPGGNPFPYNRLSQFPKLSDYYYVDHGGNPSPDYQSSSPQVHSWNLSIQRQIPGSMLFSASYVGNQVVHTWVGGYRNRSIYFPGTAVNGICTAQGYTLRTTGTCSTTTNQEQRRPLILQNPVDGAFYSHLYTREDVGTQHYHGMLLSLQRRGANGTIGANYTWSHCIGINPGANSTGNGTVNYIDPNNRSFDYGNCADIGGADRRHVFNLTGVVPSPQFNGLTGKLASGWQLGGIFRASSGPYFTVATGIDRALNGTATGQRPNQILASPYGNRNSITNYLNPAAFAQPALGTIGNMRPFGIYGPGYWQIDTALSRTFQVREGQKFEFRAEAFNLTNRFIPGQPTTNGTGTTVNLNSNTFGQITTSQNSTGPTSATPSSARVMQFALRYVF
jgi:hypothetical protein